MNARFCGTPVSLEALLLSREARAEKQRALLAAYGCTVLCLLTNIPGAVKECDAARTAFFAGTAAVSAMLQEAGAAVRFREERLLTTGPEGYWAVELPPDVLKRRCMALEEEQKQGRLWDLDVIGANGVPLSRREITGTGRSCMVCGEPAADCVRTQRHSAQELEAAILRLLEPSERT